jgi:alpha-beta hydrolase superfamily lysophospholipase
VRYSLLAMPVIFLAAGLAFARAEPAARTAPDTTAPVALIRPEGDTTPAGG